MSLRQRHLKMTELFACGSLIFKFFEYIYLYNIAKLLVISYVICFGCLENDVGFQEMKTIENWSSRLTNSGFLFLFECTAIGR